MLMWIDFLCFLSYGIPWEDTLFMSSIERIILAKFNPLFRIPMEADQPDEGLIRSNSRVTAKVALNIHINLTGNEMNLTLKRPCPQVRLGLPGCQQRRRTVSWPTCTAPFSPMSSTWTPTAPPWPVTTCVPSNSTLLW
jgi:hypothetical protein